MGRMFLILLFVCGVVLVFAVALVLVVVALVLAFVLGIILILYGAYLAVEALRERIFVVRSCYEWLEVLHHTEWKTLHQLEEEMIELKKKECHFLLILNDFHRLYQEQLVEVRLGVINREEDGTLLMDFVWRLTQKGLRRKLKRGERFSRLRHVHTAA